MSEFTHEGKRWKVTGSPMDRHNASLLNGTYVRVEEVPAPADDWATRAARACGLEYWGPSGVSDLQVQKWAAIIRECAPKPASELSELECCYCGVKGTESSPHGFLHVCYSCSDAQEAAKTPVLVEVSTDIIIEAVNDAVRSLRAVSASEWAQAIADNLECRVPAELRRVPVPVEGK
jgi:hypothetical protein